MTWKSQIQRLCHRVGVHVERWPPRSGGSRRQRLLESLGVDVLFDVGANVGQYATQIRSQGYEGQIVSFEPLAAAFHALERAARGDPRWAVRHVGLGETPGEAEINVSSFSQSSSLLPMAQRHRELFPGTGYRGTEKIRIDTLDSASGDFLRPSTRAALKMDVQGYEMNVLRGSPELLRRAVFVESEMLFVELYHGQGGVKQLVDTFYDAGLRLASFEPGPVDQTGSLVFGDCIFVRDPVAVANGV